MDYSTSLTGSPSTTTVHVVWSVTFTPPEKWTRSCHQQSKGFAKSHV